MEELGSVKTIGDAATCVGVTGGQARFATLKEAIYADSQDSWCRRLQE